MRRYCCEAWTFLGEGGASVGQATWGKRGVFNQPPERLDPPGKELP